MTLDQLNQLSDRQCHAELFRCCGSAAWIEGMLSCRPFRGREEMFRMSREVWMGLTQDDWLEAFRHHPQIGDLSQPRQKFAATSEWSNSEQAGVEGADAKVLNRLAEGNRLYLEKFGFIFLVCASGKSAAQMLSLLEERLGNGRETEITLAAGEQAKITKLRLEKLIS